MKKEQRNKAARLLGQLARPDDVERAIATAKGATVEEIQDVLARVESYGISLDDDGRGGLLFDDEKMARLSDAERAACKAEFGYTPEALKTRFLADRSATTTQMAEPRPPAVDPNRPWMTALEMQFAALRNVRKATVIAPGMADWPTMRMLPNAQTFAWSRDTTMAVWLASKSIPDATTIDWDFLETGRAAWWWFEWPLPIPMESEERSPDGHAQDVDEDALCGVVVGIEAGRTTIVITRATPYGPLATGIVATPLGVTIGGMKSGVNVMQESSFPGTKAYPVVTPRALALYRFVTAGSVWLRQRIVSSSTGHIERHRRKQIAREHRVPPPSDVRVIELRRTETQTPNAGEATSVDWSCRWIVSGHWRNQRYANDEHKLIYIEPFVKGPEDRPLRVPTHTVYQVDR